MSYNPLGLLIIEIMILILSPTDKGILELLVILRTRLLMY